MSLTSKIISLLLFLMFPVAAVAGSTVLTLLHNGKTVEFSLEDLESMPQNEFVTSTTWTEGPQTFTGVALVDFVATNRLASSRFKAYAINDYSVEIPLSDAIEGGPMIAIRRNGELMSVRDKGPLWIVYPYDSDPKYQTEVIYSRSIWQLDRIEGLN